MLSAGAQLCDCCALPVDPLGGEDCPRCGYPVQAVKEERFLKTSLRDLERVAAYGGAHITITQLIQRYRFRLSQLQALQSAQSVQALRLQDSQRAQDEKPSVFVPTQPAAQLLTPARFGSAPQQEHVAPSRVFSWRSFFADQTINIVASLGAFLLLIGALSFIVSTTNLLLSFLVIAAVHVCFGAIGIASYRFPTFRVVAVIYTTISALLVPLVGFSGYRVVAGQLTQLTPPTIVSISALYAALVYAMLALYQRFTPFGYLAVAALVVADLAGASALHLGYWWWPVGLIVLAFPALITEVDTARLWQGAYAILREPVRMLMFFCAIACAMGIVTTVCYSLSLDMSGHAQQEVRFAIVCMLLLSFCWLCLLCRFQRFRQFVVAVPYIVLCCVISCCYALALPKLGYVLVLIALAWLYSLFARFTASVWQTDQGLREHMEGLALVIVGGIPFIAAPSLLLQVFTREYIPSTLSFPATNVSFVEILVLMAGFALTINVLFRRTKMLRLPQNAWCWLLLLSGFVLNYAYALVVLAVGGEPLWWFTAWSLMSLLLAVVVRRRVSASWANPLDILALCSLFQTVLLSWSQPPERMSALWLSFFALSYGILLYQRRNHLLFFPLLFVIVAILPLFHFPLVLFACGLLLPLFSILVHRFFVARWSHEITAQTKPESMLPWEWPLLATGVLYSLLFVLHDSGATTSTVQGVLHAKFPLALEVATFSLVWYVAALWSRVKWWLAVSVGWAIFALLMPGNPFWVLAWLAPVLACLACVVHRTVGRDWALPFYTVAIASIVVAGGVAYSQKQLPAATWVLLIFALNIYGIGAIQKHSLLMWLASPFALWSAYDAALLDNVYCLFTIATVGVGSALCIGRFLSSKERDARIRSNYTLPLYAVALAAAVLTAIPLSPVWNINRPFFAAIPILLFVYALMAYGVMLLECVAEGITVTTLLATWAILLLPWALWQQMLACTVLCVCIFATQYVWRNRESVLQWTHPARLYSVLGLGGQTLVVLVIILAGGLVPNAGVLAHMGAGALFVLSMLVFWYGYLQPAKEHQRQCYYGAGLLLSLIIPWELTAFGLTHIDWLTLAPATYLIVVSPFLSRDTSLTEYHVLGRLCALVGAGLLLLPTLWLSFTQENLQPILLLGAEALALLLLGITTRVRVFVLSGAALVIVSGMHVLFLPSLGIPPSIALTVLGGTLLVIATGLSLARHRLQAVWSRWE